VKFLFSFIPPPSSFLSPRHSSFLSVDASFSILSVFSCTALLPEIFSITHTCASLWPWRSSSARLLRPGCRAHLREIFQRRPCLEKKILPPDRFSSDVCRRYLILSSQPCLIFFPPLCSKQKSPPLTLSLPLLFLHRSGHRPYLLAAVLICPAMELPARSSPAHSMAAVALLRCPLGRLPPPTSLFWSARRAPSARAHGRTQLISLARV
jgi:hypothetical protein